MNVEALVEQLAQLPGVVAVALGGSRARGAAQAGSDWDFGLYYRGSISANAVRALGHDGEVVEPGRWGRFVNGGAWLRIAGERVDLLYRDLDVVEHWLHEAEQGRFAVDTVPGYLVGMASYVLAGELALNRVLAGSLPQPNYPVELRRTAPPWWRGQAAIALLYAEKYALRGEVAACAGALVQAGAAVAQARLAERGEWILNDKGMLHRAGLDELDVILADIAPAASVLADLVARVRRLTQIGPPAGLKLDGPAEEPGAQ